MPMLVPKNKGNRVSPINSLHERCYGAGGEGVALSALSKKPMERQMQSNDLSRSFTAFDQDNTLVIVIE